MSKKPLYATEYEEIEELGELCESRFYVKYDKAETLPYVVWQEDRFPSTKEPSGYWYNHTPCHSFDTLAEAIEYIKNM